MKVPQTTITNHNKTQMAIKPNYDWRTHTHHMVTVHNAPTNKITELLIGRPTQNNPLIQQLTQPQKMETPISHDNTFPLLEQTPQRQNSDSGNALNRLVEANAGVASQQGTQRSSALFKPTTTNTLTFDGKNEKFELFEDLFQTMLKLHPEISKSQKN